MERKIGEIFDYNGEWYQCVEELSWGVHCNGCDFIGRICSKLNPKCSPAHHRSDGKSVIFKKLEKVGEPFTSVGKLYQHYKVFEIDNVCGDGFWCVHNYKAKTLTIEIKQNKEDMEERELDPHMAKVIDEATQKLGEEIGRQIEENINKQKMKPFNLEAAKAGKPVCTRDGRKARIICFDRNDLYPIVALIECEDGKERIGAYSKQGQTEIYEIKGTDLMMLPEKKEGWILLQKDGWVFDNEEVAKKNCTDDYFVAKVEWEE